MVRRNSSDHGFGVFRFVPGKFSEVLTDMVGWLVKCKYVTSPVWTPILLQVGPT